LLKTTHLLFLFRNTEVLLQKVGGSRMYTFEPPILYSEDTLRGAFSGQYPNWFLSSWRSRVWYH